MTSPHHADLLLVTRPVARYAEQELRRTDDAIPETKPIITAALP
jgi:Ni,Fe-hydrogenase III small subunit